MQDLAATKFTEEELSGDEEKVAFYTGLPIFVMVLSLLNLLKGHISHSSRNVLTQFEELMLFKMRMKLGSQVQDIAFHFDVSQYSTDNLRNVA